MFLNTKIPPPVVTILFAIMIFYFSDNFAYVDLPFKIYISLFFISLGFIVTFSSARNFKKKDTTVNPMKPNETTKLVTDGFFKITRNPMYLGMLLFLLGLSIYNGLIVGLIFLPLFVGYITYFQIIPEENAMLELFGEEFTVYMKKVRRWI
ncbi:MAG: methyltransferase family protein [Alphaproteobacteria bacterium]|jgi:protein-S-isoprenylcysteine O-methyltransferase Ste14|tara:strand:- start:519 stop:971 length:453 start_codon:yes stop_codon:yes gene_type:complete